MHKSRNNPKSLLELCIDDYPCFCDLNIREFREIEDVNNYVAAFLDEVISHRNEYIYL